MSNRIKGIIITIIAGICWGFSGACGQFLFDNKGVTSNWLVPIRLISAGTAVLVFLFIREGKKVFAPWKNKRDAKEFLIFATCGMTLCQYSYFTAIQYSNAGVATVLQYTGPVLILAWVCLKEKRLPKGYEGLALLLTLAGAFILTTRLDFNSMVLTRLAIIWGIIAAIGLAIYSVQPARIVSKYGSLMPVGWGMFIGGVLLMIAFKPWTISGVVFDFSAFLALVGVVLFGTVIAFSLYFKGMLLIGPLDAAMVSCVEPIAAVMLSVVWLGEKFVIIDIVGMVIIIAGVLVISSDKGSKSNE